MKHLCAFNYRFVPAVRLARELIDAGEIGEIRHFRGRYLQDWGDDPSLDTWRFHADEAGSGALGDLGAHVVDLSRYLVGDIATVSALVKTFLPGRQVDDAIEAAVEFENGAIGTIESTRLALGRRNAFQWEINGTKGSLAFDMERLNEIQVFRNGGRTRGFTTVLVTEADHPVLGVLVAARPHHRLGRHVRERALAPARRDRGRHRRSPRTARRSRTATAPPRSATRSSARARAASASNSATDASPVISRWDRSVVEAFQHLHWGPADWSAELLSDWWVKSLVIIGIGLIADIWRRRFPLGVGLATISYLAAEGLSLEMKSWFDRRAAVASPTRPSTRSSPCRTTARCPRRTPRARSRPRSPSASSTRSCGGRCSCSPR